MGSNPHTAGMGEYTLVFIVAKNHRTLTVYDTYANNKQVPLIRLQGKWLQKLGFTIGGKIVVEEKEKGTLLITALGMDNTDG